MTEKDRLIQFIDTLGLSKRAFLASADISLTYIANLKGSISINIENKIKEKYPQLNFDWIRTGIGNMTIDNQNIDNQNINNQNIDNTIPMSIKKAPLIPPEMSYVQNICIQDFIKCNKNVKTIFPSQLFPSFDYMYQIQTNYMSPMIEKGDIVFLSIVQNYNRIINGEIYLIDTPNNGLIIGSLIKKGNEYICKGYNDNYPDYIFYDGEFYDIYRVCGVFKPNVAYNGSDIFSTKELKKCLAKRDEQLDSVISEMSKQNENLSNLIKLLIDKSK